MVWVLQLVGELVNTEDIWEVRVQFAGNIFRLLGFFVHNELIILTKCTSVFTQAICRGFR